MLVSDASLFRNTAIFLLATRLLAASIDALDATPQGAFGAPKGLLVGVEAAAALPAE